MYKGSYVEQISVFAEAGLDKIYVALRVISNACLVAFYVNVSVNQPSEKKKYQDFYN